MASNDLDLDDILSNALDELDDEDTTTPRHPPTTTTSSTISSSPSSALPPPPTVHDGKETGLKGADGGLPPLATDSSSSASSPAAAAAPPPPNPSSSFHNGYRAATAGGSDDDISKEEQDLKDTIEKTIEMLNRGSVDADLQSGGGEDGLFNDAFLEQLASEFEKMGNEMRAAGEGGGGGAEGGEEEGVVDDVVRQLLCKELMYPPIKHMCEQYPAWLERQRGKMDSTTHTRYTEQHQLFIQIVEVYENDEGNFNRLLDLMTQVQEYGQPPKEIVDQLLPEGMPNEMNPFGALGGFGGGGPGGEQCAVM